MSDEEKQCVECGEMTFNEERCRDCGLEHIVATACARYDRLAEAFPSRGEGWRIAARILRRVDASERVTSRLVAELPDGTPRENTPRRVRVSRDGDHARRDCADRAEMRGSVSRVVTHGWGLW